MSLAASPPRSASVPPSGPSEALDAEITSVRAESSRLTAANKLLRASLLSSTRFQSKLGSSQNLPADLTPLLSATQHTSEANVHRLAFGITAFPFTDPEPTLPSKHPLLGVRIDVPRRDGTFPAPYYLFLRRTEFPHELSLHRHTLPALVPIERYERQFLPLSDEGYDSGASDIGSDTSRPQDLHGLVAAVRRDLVSWQLRTDAISLLGEQLEVPSTGEDEMDEVEDDDTPLPVGKYGVCEIAATGVDALFIRLIWADGKLGRVKIDEQGNVEKAVVLDDADERVGDLERLLAEGAPHICDLGERLAKVYERLLAR